MVFLKYMCVRCAQGDRFSIGILFGIDFFFKWNPKLCYNDQLLPTRQIQSFYIPKLDLGKFNISLFKLEIFFVKI